MRLVNTSTFKLASFFDTNLPGYAILSHTWGDEEITLQELQQNNSTNLLSLLRERVVNGESLADVQGIKSGFVKIVGCTLQAEKDGFEYVWCDTCCIDKTNSTELSEAINSMYYWYKDQLCYAYMADVPHSDVISLSEDSPFAKSRWFTRGWTLQELIAPSSVVFFDKDWARMGSRTEFETFISKKTGVDRSVLGGEDPTQCSIAKRMSWASHRETTREEDIAYCLMGLFGVNMPLLYGEREKAFLRLQEEIMKVTNDHSLFAWKRRRSTDKTDSDQFAELLARSPADFSESRYIVPFTLDGEVDLETEMPYSMTNMGLSISLPVLPLKAFLLGTTDRAESCLASLNCRDTTDSRGPLGIYLVRNERNHYRRCRPDELIPTGANLQEPSGAVSIKNLHVEQREFSRRVRTKLLYVFHIAELSEDLLPMGAVLKVFPCESNAAFDPGTGVLRCSRGLGAAVYIGKADGRGRIWLVGVDPHMLARCYIDHADEKRSSSSTELSIAAALVEYRNDSAEALLTYSNNSPLKTYKLADEKERLWDNWSLQRSRRTDAFLDLTPDLVAQSRSPKFSRSKSQKHGNRIVRTLSAVVKEAVIRGERMFSVRFDISELPEDLITLPSVG